MKSMKFVTVEKKLKAWFGRDLTGDEFGVLFRFCFECTGDITYYAVKVDAERKEKKIAELKVELSKLEEAKASAPSVEVSE